LLYAGGNRDRFRRQGLTAFGRVGVGLLDNSEVSPVPFEQNNGVHLLIGAGLEYMTPIGLGIRAEGISFDEDVRYAQVSLMYRTGRKQRIRRPVVARARPPVLQAAAPPPPPPPPIFAPPLPAPVVATAPNPCEGLTGVLEAVGFRTDSSGLTLESTLILDQVAATLSQCTELDVEVSAHTDSVGTEDYN